MKFDQPFSRIYQEVLRKTYEQYVQYQRMQDYKALYRAKPASEDISGMVDREGEALANRLQVTAAVITDRLGIHNEHYDRMLYNWLEVKNTIHEVAPEQSYKMRDSSRRISGLEGQLVSISKDLLEEKVRCWEQLIPPMQTFLETFEKYEQHKLEKRMLGDLA